MKFDLTKPHLLYFIAFSTALHSMLLALFPPQKTPSLASTVLRISVQSLPVELTAATATTPLPLRQSSPKRRLASYCRHCSGTATSPPKLSPTTTTPQQQRPYPSEEPLTLGSIRKWVASQQSSRPPILNNGPAALRPPAVAKQVSPLERDIDKATRSSCHTAYAQLGLLAAVPLVVDSLTDKGCKW